MVDPADELLTLTIDEGAGGTIYIPVNVSLSLSIAVIEAAIEAALDAYPATYTAVFVTRTDLGGGLYHYFFEILNSSEVITVAGFTGLDVAVFAELCDTTPPIEATNMELREDGSIELREDLFFELRE